MPVKSSVRYIYNIYMGKASEFAQEKNALSRKVILQNAQSNNEKGSVSPEMSANKKGANQGSVSPRGGNLSKIKSKEDLKNKSGRLQNQSTSPLRKS